MSERRPLSRLALDRKLVGSRAKGDPSFCGETPEIRAELEALRREDEAFLSRFPGPSAMGLQSDRVDGARVEEPRRRSKLVLASACVAACAIVSLSLYALHPARQFEPRVRAKGESRIELMRLRGDSLDPVNASPLHEGDLLLIRYTTDLPHLVIVGAGSTSRTDVLLASADGRSRRVTPGQDISLEQGFSIDAEPGEELIVALLSADALDASQVAGEVDKLRSASKLDGAALCSSLTGFGCSASIWILAKEPR